MRYAAVGHCIYCGSDGSPDGLSDEHIIPYALHGDHILPQSSCSACAAITSRMERFIARDMYGSFRRRENLRTRRPTKRPKTVEVTGPFGRLDIPEEAEIAQFPIVEMPPPGILQVPANEGSFVGTCLSYKADGPRQPDTWKDLPVGELKFSPSSIQIITFAQFCAKIGHSYAVALFGADGFTPFLEGEILKPTTGLPRFVGGSQDARWSEHVTNVLSWHGYETAVGRLLGIVIHLFPGMGQPPIDVIVGSLSDAQWLRLEEHGTRT